MRTCATAIWTEDKCEVWVPTQNGEAALAAATQASGLPIEKCDVYKLLLGGGFGNTKPYGAHDWNYILTEIGLLQYNYFLATAIFIIGYGIMLLSLLWGLLVIIKHYKGMRSQR